MSDKLERGSPTATASAAAETTTITTTIDSTQQQPQQQTTESTRTTTRPVAAAATTTNNTSYNKHLGSENNKSGNSSSNNNSNRYLLNSNIMRNKLPNLFDARPLPEVLEVPPCLHLVTAVPRVEAVSQAEVQQVVGVVLDSLQKKVVRVLSLFFLRCP